MALRTAKRLIPALALLLVVAYLVKRYLVHPGPEAILEQTAERYRNLAYYADTTTVKSDLAAVEGSYEFAYARPNRLRVQFHGLLDDELVVCDGITLYVCRPTVNEYRVAPAAGKLPDQLPGAQPMLKLSLLNGTAPLHRMGRARYLGREKVRGRWAHRVRIVGERGEEDEGGATSTTPVTPRASRGRKSARSTRAGRARAGVPPAVPGLADMVLWIRADDGLICRSDITLTLGTETVTHSLLCDGISTTRPSPGSFTFDPPPGARPVASFQPPQVEPDIGPSIGAETGEEQD